MRKLTEIYRSYMDNTSTKTIKNNTNNNNNRNNNDTKRLNSRYFTISSLCILLLLLLSRLHLWGTPFSVRFLCMWPFFNPTIEVVVFHLCGWCMLGVFLLPAFTCLEHECHESVWWNACVHRLDLGLYSHSKEFLGNGVRTHVNSKGKILPSPSSHLPEAQRRVRTHNAA